MPYLSVEPGYHQRAEDQIQAKFDSWHQVIVVQQASTILWRPALHCQVKATPRAAPKYFGGAIRG